MRGAWKAIPVDIYMVLLVATVVLATVLPASGRAATLVAQVSAAAIALLFFLYGARLKTQAIVAGITNWKLQLLVVVATFVLFPAAGLALARLAGPWLSEELVAGVIFLAILPSTVQSSIALTAIARGNVPAAICAASLSNMLGVVVTPAFAALLLSASGMQVSADAVLRIFVQLLLPFAAGQLLRPWIGTWIESRKTMTMIVDRGSILLIVYSAFSAGMVAGIWGRLDAATLSVLVVLCWALLLLAVFALKHLGRLAGLAREDRISLLFCGSQKSLASGVPIANILFASHAVSLIILPLMLYHQFQLFLSAALAQRYAADVARVHDGRQQGPVH